MRISLEVLLQLLEHDGGHLHRLHEHERVELHHILVALGRVFVCAVVPVARLIELAHDLGVYVHALVAVGALREEFARLGRMEVRTRVFFFVAVGEVAAADLVRLLLRLLLLRLGRGILLEVWLRVRSLLLNCWLLRRC